MKQITIYGLQDPHTREFRYVGASKDVLTRYRHHLYAKRGDSARRKWLETLEAQGERPYLVLLEQVSEGQAADCELRWIARLTSEGHPLTNREVVREAELSQFGSLVMEFARKRGVTTALGIQKRIEQETGAVCKAARIRDYLLGKHWSSREFNEAFYDAFKLTDSEARRLAWAYLGRDEEATA